MKILYLLKQDLDSTAQTIVDEHKKTNEVSIVDIRENKNYDEIIELVESNEKVISW